MTARAIAPRIFTAAVWTHGDTVDVAATLQSDGAYVTALACTKSVGVALQVLGKHQDESQERTVTVMLDRDQALQLAAEVMDALDDSEERLEKGGSDGRG